MDIGRVASTLERCQHSAGSKYFVVSKIATSLCIYICINKQIYKCKYISASTCVYIHTYVYIMYDIYTYIYSIVGPRYQILCTAGCTFGHGAVKGVMAACPVITGPRVLRDGLGDLSLWPLGHR